MILLSAFAAGSVLLPSCATKAGTAVTGAAAYKVYDDNQEQEKREDAAKYKYAKDNKKNNRQR